MDKKILKGIAGILIIFVTLILPFIFAISSASITLFQGLFTALLMTLIIAMIHKSINWVRIWFLGE